MYTDNAFVTLTYSDPNLPMTSTSLPTLEPKDLQLWLKQLRRTIHPSKVRYYATGEYGEQTNRPHYHLALFGFPNCLHAASRYSRKRRDCCNNCDLIRDTWGRGQIHLGEINVTSAQYIAGYVTKKLTSRDDPRLLGRHPEFGRMSLKPGIGADFMHEAASTLLSLSTLDRLTDVPTHLQHGNRKLPLGRYLRRRLRLLVGRDENVPQEIIDQLQAELLPLREAAFNASRSFKTAVIEDGNQAALNQEARAKIFKQRKTL